MQQNLVGWFEIPVNDMDRAQKFYETVFEIEIKVHNFGGILMGWFPFDESKTGTSGSLIKQDTYIPSQEGTMIYFVCDDLQNELERVPKAGGKIRQKKTQISPEHGYMGVFIDSEGNRVALHSNK